jgi:hypothetical protein
MMRKKYLTRFGGTSGCPSPFFHVLSTSNPNLQSTVISTASSLVYTTSPLTLNPPFGTEQKHAEITQRPACWPAVLRHRSDAAKKRVPARQKALLYAVQLAYSSNWQRRETGARDIFFALPVCLSLAAAVSSSSICKVDAAPSHTLLGRSAVLAKGLV